MIFDITDNEDIKEGKATDKYFEMTEESLKNKGNNPEVVAEITESQYAEGEYKVFTGVKEAAELLKGLDIDVYCLEEGRMFNGGPVLRIEGDYLEFARYETALLGILSHNSGIATNANEIRCSAPKSKILSFGARHVHPSLGNIVERNSMIAGLDGFSFVPSEKTLNMESSGTMPHALILSSNNKEEAWESFNEISNEDDQCIALCDTFTDEVDEVVKAAKTLGDDLDGVRLDTTSSRRGDFKRIIKEVRWELDNIEREDVSIYVSGGLGPKELKNLKHLVDGFGVGGYISNADPLDFGLDIVVKNGKDISKRGKLSGKKRVYREKEKNIHKHSISQDTSNEIEDLMKPLIKNGEVVRNFEWRESKETLEEERKKLFENN